VQQLFAQHRAAVLREGIAQVDALPRFDAIGEVNTGGRAGYNDWSGAMTDSRRYTDRPGGVIGFRLEVPLASDDARARLDRRRLETRQVENQSRATLASIVAEAEVTLNEYRVAFRELSARGLSLNAAQADLRMQTERWRQGLGAPAGQPDRLGVSGAAGAYALDRLLDAQERVAAAEDALANAQSVFTVAAIQLERVRGTFTALEKIDFARTEEAPRGTTYTARRAPTARTATDNPANTIPPGKP
jgi:outer membrane protein TolC